MTSGQSLPPAPKGAPLPERIRAARITAGFTQERLANTLGVNLSTLQRWESGEAAPDAVLRLALADVLGWSPDFFNHHE